MVQEVEQQLSSLRVEACQKGCGLITHCGIGLSAMGKTALESMLGPLPLALCMTHFIGLHAEAMIPPLLETCQQLQLSWEQQENRFVQSHDSCVEGARHESALYSWPVHCLKLLCALPSRWLLLCAFLSLGGACSVIGLLH